MSALTAGRDTTGRELLARYARQGASTRLHVTLRWRTCPLSAIARHAPATGMILDLGCGHGLLSHLLARGHSGRVVYGTDVDLHKLAHAAAATSESSDDGTVEFVPARTDVPEGPWDAIVIADVLYLMSPHEQRDVVTACAAALAPSGVLLVKAMASEPRWKAAWARAQEVVAVHLCRWTQGEVIAPVDTTEIAQWMQGCGLHTAVIDLSRGYLHPHSLIVASRDVVPAGEAGRRQYDS